jgi:RHS repeat-associated protein
LSESSNNSALPKLPYKYQGVALERNFGLETFETFYRGLDPQIGRFNSIDPKAAKFFATSPYASMDNNPVSNVDPLGDYKTEFGAWVGNLTHGGSGIEQNIDKSSKFYGQWYYKKDMNSSSNGTVVVRPNTHYGGGINGKVGSGGLSSGGSIDQMADRFELYLEQKVVPQLVKASKSELWNSPIARAFFNDYYTIGFGGTVGAGVFMGREGTFILMLRGQKPGLYYAKTYSGGIAPSAGSDASFSLGWGRYNGDLKRFNSSTFEGNSVSVSGGAALKAIGGASINAGLDWGLGPNGSILTSGSKISISAGVGVSTPITGSYSSGVTTEVQDLND